MPDNPSIRRRRPGLVPIDIATARAPERDDLTPETGPRSRSIKAARRPSAARPPLQADAEPSTPPAGKVRLQRHMAELGVGSRRRCESMIERGQVEVNGRIQSTLPVFVDPRRDRVTVDGRLLPRVLPNEGVSRRTRGRDAVTRSRTYLLVHKPAKVLTTTHAGAVGAAHDESGAQTDGRRTILDLVKVRQGVRLFPVGRLDFHATGLVLLTNDGQLAQRLTHARYGIPKVYHVTVRGSVNGDILEALRRRIGLPKGAAERLRCDVLTPAVPSAINPNDQPRPPGDRRRGPAAAASKGAAPPSVHPRKDAVRAVDHPDLDDRGIRLLRAGESGADGRTTIEIILSEGRGKGLGDILLQMGCPIRAVRRVAIGPLQLGRLPEGKVRELSKQELWEIRRVAGLTGRAPAAESAEEPSPEHADTHPNTHVPTRRRAAR